MYIRLGIQAGSPGEVLFKISGPAKVGNANLAGEVRKLCRDFSLPSRGTKERLIMILL